MTRPDKKDLVAQWAFDTRPLLLRFHLWLEDVAIEWQRGGDDQGYENFGFIPAGLRRCVAMSSAVTALGTRLFAPFGQGKGADKRELNRVKKEADAISAYVMSESLWHFTRRLPENHAVMVSLGEGLMPKAGETPEMGANPLLGFGRVYARPELARFIDSRVHRLLNDPGYGWKDFYKKMRNEGVTIWGAAVDTLENTSRFAKGEELGPTCILHLFDQPLTIARPYEAYMGTLALPRELVRSAEDRSIHIDLLTPRAKILEAIELAYPGVRRENVHVWTLGGKSRSVRLQALWDEWRALGAHLVEDGWICPTGLPAFTESGTYAPTYLVGAWTDPAGATHVFLCDGYAASAEALQAATLSDALGLDVSMAPYSPKFELGMAQEHALMRLDPDDAGFASSLAGLFGSELPPQRVEDYRGCIRDMVAANVPHGSRVIRADDFFPEKRWQVLAATGFIGVDPYTGLPGVTRVADDTYRVTTQLATRNACLRVDLTLRLLESAQQSRLVFSPLLERFLAGEEYKKRAVKISDSGRIRNELQTLCSQALEYGEADKIIVHFDRVDEQVISGERQDGIRRILEWYRTSHPVWFAWLEIA